MVPVWQRSRRPAVPARVHYAFDTSWDFGPLVDSGSAWLQHLRAASGTQATASAEALTVARPLTALTETTTTGGAVTDRSAYLLRDSLRHRTRNRPVSNALSVSLTNVAASSVDLGPLRVDTGRRYCIDVTSDTYSTVALTGRNLSRLAVAGVTATRRGSGAPPAGLAGYDSCRPHPAGSSGRCRDGLLGCGRHREQRRPGGRTKQGRPGGRTERRRPGGRTKWRRPGVGRPVRHGQRPTGFRRWALGVLAGGDRAVDRACARGRSAGAAGRGRGATPQGPLTRR